MSALPTGILNLKAEMAGYLPEFRDSITIVTDSLISGIAFNLSRCIVPSNVLASDTLHNSIQINWDAVAHPKLLGYNIYRSLWEIGAYSRINSALLTSPSYSDAAPDTVIYWYKVSAVYGDSAWTAESFVSNPDAGRLQHEVGISDNQAAIPKEFFLSQNYPNPFNPVTTISYGLPKASHVKIEVFNIIGQKTLTLVDENQQAGYKKIIWNGHDSSGEPVASGVYFYRLRTGDKEIVHKMSLIK